MPGPNTRPLNVQYRDNLISAAAAIEIPGLGVVTYDFDRETGAFGRITSIPDGVQFSSLGRMNIQGGGFNSRPLALNSITWMENGREQSLALSPGLNLAIQEAGIPHNNANLVNRYFSIDREQGTLNYNPNTTDRIIRNGREDEVLDIKTGTRIAATPTPNVQTASNDRSPAGGRH